MSLRTFFLLTAALLVAVTGVLTPTFSTAAFTATTKNAPSTVTAAADWTPPTVALRAPGASVTGTVALTADATDAETGVQSVTIEYLAPGAAAWTRVCTTATRPVQLLLGDRVARRRHLRPARPRHRPRRLRGDLRRAAHRRRQQPPARPRRPRATSCAGPCPSPPRLYGAGIGEPTRSRSSTPSPAPASGRTSAASPPRRTPARWATTSVAGGAYDLRAVTTAGHDRGEQRRPDRRRRRQPGAHRHDDRPWQPARRHPHLLGRGRRRDLGCRPGRHRVRQGGHHHLRPCLHPHDGAVVLPVRHHHPRQRHLRVPRRRHGRRRQHGDLGRRSPTAPSTTPSRPSPSRTRAHTSPAPSCSRPSRPRAPASGPSPSSGPPPGPLPGPTSAPPPSPPTRAPGTRRPCATAATTCAPSSLDRTGATTVSAVVAGRLVDNSPLRALDVQTVNGGRTEGLAEPNDRVILTYSQQVNLSSISAGWTGAALPVTVRMRDGQLLGLGRHGRHPRRPARRNGGQPRLGQPPRGLRQGLEAGFLRSDDDGQHDRRRRRHPDDCHAHPRHGHRQQRLDAGGLAAGGDDLEPRPRHLGLRQRRLHRPGHRDRPDDRDF